MPYIKHELEAFGIKVLAPQFPDQGLARAQFWMPFLEQLGVDENTIIIGHSTGAIAAMRIAETHKLLGSVLVGAYASDLGLETEKQSGYFDNPWRWQPIKDNQQWIVQFASTDDPWIPASESRLVHQNLATEYYESTDQGHFGGDYYKPEFPELLAVLKKKLKIISA